RRPDARLSRRRPPACRVCAPAPGGAEARGAGRGRPPPARTAHAGPPPPAPAPPPRPAGWGPRGGGEPKPGKQLVLAVDRHVPHTGRLDPLANGVGVLAAGVAGLPTLDGDRPPGDGGF